MSTVVTSNAKRLNQSDGEAYTPTQFCRHHDLILGLVPFEYRELDPFELLQAAHDIIDELPETAATFHATDVVERAGSASRGAYADHRRVALHLLGAWKPDQLVSTQWVNPQYVHEDALAPVDAEFAAHVHTCASLGILTHEQIGARFGLSKSAVRGRIYRRQIPWMRHRHQGMRRLVRTIATAARWTGRDRKQYYDLLPANSGTLRNWTTRRVTNTDWEIPARPEWSR